MRRRHRRSPGIRSGSHNQAVLSIDVCVRLPQRQGAPVCLAGRSGAEEGEDRRPPARRRLYESSSGARIVEAGRRGKPGWLQHVLLERESPSSIIDAVARGTIDVAIVWGPAAGLFVKRQRVPLAMVPVPSGKGDLPFEFDISMGVKPGNDALRAQLERVLDAKQRRDYEDPEGLRRATDREKGKPEAMTARRQCWRLPPSILSVTLALFFCDDDRRLRDGSADAPSGVDRRSEPRPTRTRMSTTAGSGGTCTVIGATARTPSPRRWLRT